MNRSSQTGWKDLAKNNKFRIEFFITIAALALSLFLLTEFLSYVEQRPGAILDDPVLKLFQPIDLTWLTFSLIYLSLAAALIVLIKDPERLLFTIQLYTAMVLIRIIAMYLLPLDPPADMLPLNDPFVQFFGTGKLLTRDLFFSGHTATLFLLFLVTEKKYLKILFLIFTVMVAVSVILQHVHYTIDVFAAPFFTYVCFVFLRSLRKKLMLFIID